MKIILAGPFQSGKSSIIRALDPKAMCVEATGKGGIRTTVAMDVGHFKHQGVAVTLIGTPGLMRFHIIREVLLDGTDGVMFVFDAGKPEKDDNAIEILNQVRKILPNKPIVFLAHKSDLPHARPPEVIAEQNYLQGEVFRTSVEDGQGLKQAVDHLMAEILERYETHLKVLNKYETDIRGLASELHYSKEEIRGYLNTLERKSLIKIDRQARSYRVLLES